MSRPHVRNEDRFAPIPEALLYDASIPADAVRVYGVLRRHGDDPENCYPSHARIAELIGKSARSVPGWVRALEAAGWIERFARRTAAGDPDSNGYRVFLVRAGERGVRAGEQGGSALFNTEGTRPGARQKKASERKPVKDSAAGAAVDASDSAVLRQATDLLAPEWERRKAAGQVPTCGYLPARDRVREALEAGWAEDVVRRALPEVLTFTRPSFDLALGRVANGGRSRGVPLVRLDEDRGGPSGEVRL